MRIPSGVTDQYIYFVAVDATDLKTRETGLSGFTVYRSRNGAAAAAMTTPTVNETDSANMPGVYELLCDEDMSIAAGNDSEEMVYHITVAGMAPVTRVIEVYRAKITAGYTLGVESDGDLTKVNTLDGHTAQTGDNYARIGANGASLSAVPWNASWDAEVESECNDALVAQKLDHLVAVADADDVVDDSIIAKMAASDADWSGFSYNTDSLEAISDLVNLMTVDTGFIPTILSDTIQIKGRLPAALSPGNMKSDVLAISTSTEAADNLEASAETIVIGAAAAGTLSTTQMTSDLSEATDDHYIGRIIIWTSGVLQDQATDITDYAGANGLLTYTAVTEAPGDGDTFIIV